MKRKIIEKIRSGNSAEYALKEVILEYAEKFHAMQDVYMSEREADVLDIGRRVLGASGGRFG